MSQLKDALEILVDAISMDPNASAVHAGALARARKVLARPNYKKLYKDLKEKSDDAMNYCLCNLGNGCLQNRAGLCGGAIANLRDFLRGAP